MKDQVELLKESCYMKDAACVRYQKRISELEKENKKLKEELKKDDREVQVNVDKELLKANDYLIEENKKLQEENKKIKADYIKLSKIVETTGGYKASYVNELRDKIAKLEIYKKQYKHTIGGDYIDEDLYDLDC